MSDSHSANHVLLARVPKLFVHAVLSDPALGEEAFAAFLPDTEAVRRDNRRRRRDCSPNPSPSPSPSPNPNPNPSPNT